MSTETREMEKQAAMHEQREAAKQVLQDFLSLLHQSGMSTADRAKYGFELSCVLIPYIREKPRAHPEVLDQKLRAAQLLLDALAGAHTEEARP